MVNKDLGFPHFPFVEDVEPRVRLLHCMAVHLKSGEGVPAQLAIGIIQRCMPYVVLYFVHRRDPSGETEGKTQQVGAHVFRALWEANEHCPLWRNDLHFFFAPENSTIYKEGVLYQAKVMYWVGDLQNHSEACTEESGDV